MLIEFRVTNFRCMRDEQVLSMVASSDATHQDSHCTASGITNPAQIVRSAVLYGPNASGKTKLINALSRMRYLVENSATQIGAGKELPGIDPFRFDPAQVNHLTEFEVTFIENNIRYQYGFALTKLQIIEEWLIAYAPKAQRWFERCYNAKKNEYEWHFGTNFKIGKQQQQLLTTSTRSNALFLSSAINLNTKQLEPIFFWFVNKLKIGMPFNPETFATPNMITDPIKKAIIMQFIQAADPGIDDIKIEMRKVRRVGIKFKQGESTDFEKVGEEEVEIPKVTLYRKQIAFDFNDESHGTQLLFTYAQPLLDVLENGCVLVMDELENGLHAKLIRFLVNLIHNPHINTKKAQLIFSTHNTSLLDGDLFRRDQVWFVEKDADNASHVYPLTDFSPRKDEALEKGYLAGRYGALPFIGELKF